MYSNYQPTYYNPYAYYPQPAVPQAVPPAPTLNSSPTPPPQLKLDTVSGKVGADVYNVNMGEEVILFDIDNPCVYKKSRNSDNKLELLAFDLVPHIEQESQPTMPEINLDAYVTKDSIEKMVTDRVKKEVDKRLSEISFAPKTRKKTVEVDDDE